MKQTKAPDNNFDVGDMVYGTIAMGPRSGVDIRGPYCGVSCYGNGSQYDVIADLHYHKFYAVTDVKAAVRGSLPKYEDDLCTCGHARKEHGTVLSCLADGESACWNENENKGHIEVCSCDKFRLQKSWEEALAVETAEKGETMEYVDIVFDGPPSPEGPRFIEVEDPTGKSINAGEWINPVEPNTNWALRISFPEKEPGNHYDTLKSLLSALGVKLNPKQADAIDRLDEGQSVAVFDTHNSVVGRWTEDPKPDDRLCLTMGTVVGDVVQFMRTELPALSQRVAVQTFADALNIYLAKRGWDEPERNVAIAKAIIMYKESQEKANVESASSLILPKSVVPGVGSQTRMCSTVINGKKSCEFPAEPDSLYCRYHGGPTPHPSYSRCQTSLTKSGDRCHRPVVPGSKYCRLHGGASRGVGNKTVEDMRRYVGHNVRAAVLDSTNKIVGTLRQNTGTTSDRLFYIEGWEETPFSWSSVELVDKIQSAGSEEVVGSKKCNCLNGPALQQRANNIGLHLGREECRLTGGPHHWRKCPMHIEQGAVETAEGAIGLGRGPSVSSGKDPHDTAHFVLCPSFPCPTCGAATRVEYDPIDGFSILRYVCENIGGCDDHLLIMEVNEFVENSIATYLEKDGDLCKMYWVVVDSYLPETDEWLVNYSTEEGDLYVDFDAFKVKYNQLRPANYVPKNSAARVSPVEKSE